MKNLLMGLLLLSACTEVVSPNADLSNQPDLTSIKKDLATTPEDLSVVQDLSVDLGNPDLSTPYEVLCPVFLKCCQTNLLLKYAEKFTCLHPAIPHLDYVGQSCDGGYLSIFVWCY